MSPTSNLGRRIAALVADPDPAFGRVALDLARSFDGDPFELLDLYRIDDAPLAEAATSRLAALYPFVRAHYPNPPAPAGTLSLFRVYEEREGRFLRALKRLAADPVPDGAMRRLALLEGVRDEIAAALSEEDRRRFAAVCAGMKPTLERQLTLAPTFRCNMSCPYCINWDAQGAQISDADWRAFLGWSLGQGVAKIVFTGGEPTFHPRFARYLVDLRDAGLETYFATNAIFSDAVMGALDSSFVTELAVHVRNPSDGDLDAGYTDRLGGQLRALRDKGIQFSFRYNIYAHGQDVEKLLRLADEHGPQTVRFALAVKAKRPGSEYVSLGQLEEFLPELLSLVEQCRERGFRAILAKPLPLCLFGEEGGMRLMEEGIALGFCSMFTDSFARNATVNPDLRLAPCFGMDLGDRKIVEFADWDELGRTLKSHVLPLLHKPTLEACPGCYLYRRSLCQGACLANKAD